MTTVAVLETHGTGLARAKPVTDEERIALRRRLHSVKEALVSLEWELKGVDPLASSSAREARNAVFLAWTILATPLMDDDDDH